ncbi:hypothetical protein CDO44_06030 [Pigmentiphaga sp. NML080357]|uniref:DUF3306 domain-containing protein n=1 Tax=Pigmentiphaga sp. NML080357 TaxID=2008675 RepID=UPI000B41F9CD|nr:DUF3306 domain-containing protein [Pigmentiphaga sp. NML080357]OVZ61201.1 hypothetical protein CDO44_06030 [Pigmentiphaga sp. NML080357]
MSRDNEGFFGRWSRRKAESRADVDPPRPDAAPERDVSAAPADAHTPDPAAPGGAPLQDSPPPPRHTGAVPPGPHGEPTRVPTLEDLAALSPQSDFSSFMRPGVAQDVKLAALKKLFSDPHHNVMDGLDVYIDDYSSPEALPASMLKKMVSARVLALVEDEPEAAAGGAASAPENAAPNAPPADPSPMDAGQVDNAHDAAESSMLESDASAGSPSDGQAHFDFPEPDRKT